jgi:hypothetical protein
VHATTGLRIRAAAIAAAATALTFACASMAQAATVADPDDPAVSQDLDIQSASESHVTWPSGSASITHTIRTYAPYARRPCLNFSTPTERYLACGGKLLNRTTNHSVRISFGESPAGAPDTVTYSFTSGALGSPPSYRWSATTRDSTGLLADRTVWTQTTLGSFIVPKVTYDEPIPAFDPDELRIVDLP